MKIQKQQSKVTFVVKNGMMRKDQRPITMVINPKEIASFLDFKSKMEAIAIESYIDKDALNKITKSESLFICAFDANTNKHKYVINNEESVKRFLNEQKPRMIQLARTEKPGGTQTARARGEKWSISWVAILARWVG